MEEGVSEAVRLRVGGREVFGVWSKPKIKKKPVIVFLHDGLGSVGTMRSFPRKVGAAIQLPTFVFDRFGYGRSDHEEVFPDDFMGEASHDLEEVLSAAKIDDCILVGHSDGGTVALLHGARYPTRTRAIITIAAHVRRDKLTYDQVLRHNQMYIEGKIPDWLVRFHGARAPHLLKCWTEVWQKTLYDYWDISDEISLIEIPVLAMQGAEDTYGLSSQLNSIEQSIPRSEVQLIEGLGHFPHLENPRKLISLIKEFLSPYCGP